jgi:hypothetical protein
MKISIGIIPFLVACGTNVEIVHLPNTDSGADADAADASVEAGPFVPAAHPAPPQVGSFGGPVIVSPKIIPVFFAGDSAMQKQVEQFLAQLPGSEYWSTTTSEYGVGQPTIAPSIIATDTPPTTDDAVQVWLTSMTDWPAPDANTLYAIYLPDGVTITAQGAVGCQTFGGYHFTATGTQGQRLPYALLPRCPTHGQYKGIDVLSQTSSHEIIEAATDPDLNNKAFSLVDQDHAVWSIAPLAEVGDMCALQPQSFQRLLGNSVVQRTWSNASAKAGHDPCVPVPTEPYFNSVPVLDEDVTIFLTDLGVRPTKGVKISAGTSKTIEVDLFSDAPTTDWTVDAVDVASLFTGGSPELTFTWDKQSGNNGDQLHLTITHEAKGQFRGSEFVLYSQKGTETINMWFGFVSN